MLKLRTTFLFILTAFSLNIAQAAGPERECTLKAPVSAVKLSPAQLKPYQQGNEAVLRATGLLFPPDTLKNIEAAPTGDNSTPYRTAINYHRSLRNDDAETIASYWHPAMSASKLQQLNQSGVMTQTKEIFTQLDHVELLGMLILNGREVIFIRYNDRIRAYVTVEVDGVYYLVSDPGLAPQIAIATAAFDSGSTAMTSR